MSTGDKIKLIKLRNGLEIVSFINDEQNITLFRPHILHMMSASHPSIGSRFITVCRNFLEHSATNECSLSENDIMMILPANEKVVTLYLDTLEVEDKTKELLSRIDQTNGGTFANELAQYISEMLDTNPEGMNGSPEDMKESISLTFDLTPEMFIGFLANGVVGMDDENNIDFDVTAFMDLLRESEEPKSKDPIKRPKKPKRENNPNDDDLSQFDEWNPTP
jgi:hypothetical protein